MADPTIQSVLERLDRLESYNAISQLIADYAHAFDRQDRTRLGSLWFDDSVFELGEFGRFVGREAIVAGADGLWEVIPEQHHWQANPSIEIDGDSAIGLVALDCAVTAVDGGPHMVGGYYRDRYERRNDEWKFAERTFVLEYWTPIRGPLREGVSNELDGAAST
jgi:ketosteroid isomerase-like protein